MQSTLHFSLCISSSSLSTCTLTPVGKLPCYNESSVKHSVTHHIRTTGPSVFCRPRRLAPDRMKIAKSEFEHMLQLGIIRTSDSSWSSPLHMVPKPTPGDWHPCSDYRALNKSLCLIAVLFHIFMIFPHPCMANPFLQD